ncbi:hypothetical protein Tco_0911305 [Tanacetum coccineum]|uniref:Uncharacterized protein n=1 Tax=Tanacetum coccineum TaxID=301880 RepID=A0ABQ5CWC5_9ASTR
MVVMVGDVVPWPEEAMVDWPKVRLIPTKSSRGEVKGGGVDFGVVNSLLGEILREVMGDSSGETFGVDERTV